MQMEQGHSKAIIAYKARPQAGEEPIQRHNKLIILCCEMVTQLSATYIGKKSAFNWD